MKTKVFAVLMVLLLALSPVSAFAAGDTLPQLTIKEALSKAISHSSTLKKNQEDKESLEYDVKNYKQNMLTSETTSGYLTSYKSYMNAQWKLAQMEPDTKIQKEKLEYQLTECFARIINAEKGLELTDKNLELTKANLDISALKLKLGLISQSKYDEENFSYETAVANREDTAISIDSLYRDLNEVMGQDKDKKYELVLELAYEPIGEDFDTRRVITMAIQESASVKSAEQSLNLAKYERDVALPYDERTGQYQSGTRVNNDNAVAQAGRTLDDTKNNVENSVLTTYDAVIKLERAYDSYIKDLAKNQADLEILKLQLEQGKATPIEVTAKELKIEEIEENIRKTIYNHAVEVMPLLNLNLL